MKTQPLIPQKILLIGILGSLVFFIHQMLQPTPFSVVEAIGDPQVNRNSNKEWDSIDRGDLIYDSDKVRTRRKSEVIIDLAKGIRVHLSENSELRGKCTSYFRPQPQCEVKLMKGSLLGVVDEKAQGSLSILTPNAIVFTRHAIFRIEADQKKGTDRVYVLKGNAIVERIIERNEAKEIGALHKIEVRSLILPEAEEMSQEEWWRGADAYNLITRPLGFNQGQHIYSKFTGNLFNRVIEHGDFYTPEKGFFQREFYFDPDTFKFQLKMYYDVFPDDALVGLYLKTKPFNLTKFNYLEFELKAEGARSPRILYVEFKSKRNIVRSYPIRKVTSEWYGVRIPLAGTNKRPIDEIVFYLRKPMAGPVKQGTLFLRNVHLSDEVKEVNSR